MDKQYYSVVVQARMLLNTFTGNRSIVVGEYTYAICEHSEDARLFQRDVTNQLVTNHLTEHLERFVESVIS